MKAVVVFRVPILIFKLSIYRSVNWT